jgi:hypothetical protein
LILVWPKWLALEAVVVVATAGAAAVVAVDTIVVVVVASLSRTQHPWAATDAGKRQNKNSYLPRRG